MKYGDGGKVGPDVLVCDEEEYTALRTMLGGLELSRGGRPVKIEYIDVEPESYPDGLVGGPRFGLVLSLI